MTSFEHSCRICGTNHWSVMYSGTIRLGKFGHWSDEPHVVRRCLTCQAGFLPGPELDYKSTNYRRCVDGDYSPEAYYETHDKEQMANLSLLRNNQLRGKVVADVGCGAGSFLDLVGGYARQTVAIEPSSVYVNALRAKGHFTYSYCKDAIEDYEGKANIVVSFLTIEHVEDPVEFLQEMRRLLVSEGCAIITTPNCDDWLIEFLPGVYDKFFFRMAHRWYFNGESLRNVAVRAGFSNIEIEFRQSYDLSNALFWIRDGIPTGLGKLDMLRDSDRIYQQTLERNGRSNYVCARLKP